jgi:hypothetical protein
MDCESFGDGTRGLCCEGSRDQTYEAEVLEEEEEEEEEEKKK